MNDEIKTCKGGGDSMNKMMTALVLPSLASMLLACGGSSNETSNEPPALATKEALGEKLYSDVNLSLNRTMSCATCHNPEKGFVDDRTNEAGVVRAASLGDDGTSLGDRNAPIAAYAAFSPSFHQGTRDRSLELARDAKILPYEGFMGGQFWDGREDDLKGQAGGPPTNPIEMGMPDKASVVARIKDDTDYVSGFEHVYGSDIFDDVDLAYAAMAESIGEFEKTEEFAPFDSKYDRTFLPVGNELRVEFSPISKVESGKNLFFSSDLSCAACHQLQPLRIKNEVFTSFEYHNVGVPENTALRALNKVTALDEGLLNNPAVTATTEKGKFKVPTLRNVAVTGPYMHNGIFKELDTVIRFYKHANEKAAELEGGPEAISLNPETGVRWRDPEINENVAHDLLGSNKNKFADFDIEALECFLISLTDARYESLLDAEKVTNCGLD